MPASRRWSILSEPLRGAGYVLALGGLVLLVGAALAAVSVWVMT